MVSYTVPLVGCTIVAIATIVTSFCASRCRVMVVSHSWWYLRFWLGQCEADFWKFRAQLFPVPRGRGCVCMLNFLVQQIRHYLRRHLHLLLVHVAGLCRSEQWEVYLYGYSRFKLDGQCRSEKWEIFCTVILVSS